MDNGINHLLVGSHFEERCVNSYAFWHFSIVLIELFCQITRWIAKASISSLFLNFKDEK